jgi:hypothetical protein
VASVFDRLDARRPPPEVKNKQPRRNAELRAFLVDILADGPVLATLILERAIARGFTRKQILHSRDRTKVIIAIKETGRRYGRWMWTLAPPPTQAIYRAPSESAIQ